MQNAIQCIKNLRLGMNKPPQVVPHSAIGARNNWVNVTWLRQEGFWIANVGGSANEQ